MENSKGLLKPTIIITICSILGIIVSFLSQLIIAYYFGARFERDAYFVASTIPTYITAIFTGSIGIVFLPRVINILNAKQKNISDFLSTVFWLLSITLVVIVLLTFCFPKQLVQIVATGFNSQQNTYTSKILIIIIPSIIFNVLGNLLSSLYQIRNNFLRPALSPIITSLVSLLCVVALSKKIGILGLAVGLLLGSLISFLFLIPVLKQHRLRFFINLKDFDIQSFFKTLLPLFVTGILFRSTSIFERTIASNLPEGSISYLGYSSQILAILATLTSSGIAVSVYPAISKYWAEKKMNEFTYIFIKIIRIILLISIPIAVTLIFYGDEFIKIVFQRGAFNATVTHAVSLTLAWSMGAFIFQGLGTIISKVFYISGKTTILSIIACVEIILYIVLAIILSKYYSFIGPAISLSVSSGVNIILSLLYNNKNIFKINFSILLRDISKILIANIISILVVYVLYKYIIGIHSFVVLLCCFFLGFIVFIFLALHIGIDEILYLKKKLVSFKITR